MKLYNLFVYIGCIYFSTQNDYGQLKTQITRKDAIESYKHPNVNITFFAPIGNSMVDPIITLCHEN